MKLFEKMRFMAVALIAVIGLSACSDDDPVELPQLDTPNLVQYVQISDNPITLVYAWQAVANATAYEYKLEALTAEGEVANVVTAGTTTELSVTIVSEGNITLDYGTEYRFTLIAVGDEASVRNSLPVVADFTTHEAPLTLTIENQTYRSASFIVKPSNADMRYQTAMIAYDKYAQYSSDEEFIQEYEFGYYKMLASMPWIPATWDQVLDSYGQNGDYQFNSRSMMPSSKYIFYAYGYELTDDPENPVKIVTPLLKKVFITPAWAATSATTFSLAISGQEVSEGYANVSVDVTPSDNAEQYLTMFVPADKATDDAALQSYVMTTMQSLEMQAGIEDWHQSAAVNAGAKTVTSNSVALVGSQKVSLGQPYVVAVFGVDKNGLITTNIASLRFDAISE